MGGLFGVVSNESCVLDLFFGIDYHSHLGTRRGGIAVYGKNGFDRSIHNIENSPFRTKFESDIQSMEGLLGIGCISDNEPQPLIVRSHLGTFAISTVGKINNIAELTQTMFDTGTTHFLEMSGGDINPTELVSAMINKKRNIQDGIEYAQSLIDGSMTILVLTPEGIYAGRDRLGRTPLFIGEKEGAYCATLESFAYLNLGYKDYHELGPGEVVFISKNGTEILKKPRREMKICTFLWGYYGYPSSSYEGVNVETMRYNCGRKLALRDKGNVKADMVAGVPDSGTAHAIGYSNASGIPFGRPFIKYTPTWPRSFTPVFQDQRNLIAHMKMIPVPSLIKDKSLLLIDDSIVRGTQLGETTEFLYNCGAKEVHIRPACPPMLFICKYLNFARSTSLNELIARRVVNELEGGAENADKHIYDYTDPDSPKYEQMIDGIRRKLNFTTLRYNRLDDMLDATGISPCKLCTYCWSGKE
ncbi:MAG: amidophosphoribosyltransferase [Clostridiales bacterium]|nr:amidophosphoribosyltransferase [Clostridiales bacterium]